MVGMTCPHSGKRRMILNLICQQPAADSPRVDFLDFCMERMISREEPPGVQSLCMKLAYQLTRSIPELQQELRTMLTGSRYPFRTEKYPESHESKEKQIISIAFISPFN